MSYTIKKLDKSQAELTITVQAVDYLKHLESASVRLSEKINVKGFRKGHVPYDIVKKEVGAMSLLQEALESIVQESYAQAIIEEKLDTVGGPKIDVEKVAPNNEFVYKAVVTLLPEVKLPDLSAIKINKKTVSIDEKQIDETLTALRGMHALEIKKDGPAVGTDKLMIDMDMFLDNVPVDGGTAKNYAVYLSEDHYIKGFNEQVAGLKAGDEKEFTLTFPKEHYQKQLAGKKTSFKIKVNEVLERQLPEITEEFAKKLGQNNEAELRERITENLRAEAQQKEDQRAEIEMLDIIIEKTSFGEIPEVIINSERSKIFNELLRDLEKHGVEVSKYLEDIKKTEKELMDDFTGQATKRAQAALISRQIAKDQGIAVGDDELTKELEMIRTMYKDDEIVIENLKRHEVRETIASSIQNRKVVAWLKEKIISKDAKGAEDTKVSEDK